MALQKPHPQRSTMPCAIAALVLLAGGCQVESKPETPAVTESVTETVTETVTEPVEKKPSLAAWPVFRGDAQGRASVPNVLPDPLEELWQFSVEDVSFTATAVIDNGVVYIGNTDDALHAIDLATGEERWKFEPHTAPLKPKIIIADATDGLLGEEDETKEVESKRFPAGFSAAAAVKDGRVFAGDFDGVFWCVDAETGEPLWHYRTDGEINSAANLIGNEVLVGSQDGTLYRFDAATGELTWKFTIEASGGIQSSPTFAQGQACFGGCDGKLHIVDLVNKQELGAIDIGGPTLVSPALAREFAYIGTENRDFFAINRNTQEIAWVYRDADRAQEYRSSAAIGEDAIIVGNRSKMILALDRTTGEEKWTFLTRGRVDSSPVIVGDRVFVGSGDGRLYGLRLSDGEELWRAELGGKIEASPAVAQDRLVIGTVAGTVYCFGRNDGKEEKDAGLRTNLPN